MWNNEENENAGKPVQARAPTPRGRLVVISGPSGAGKSTLVQRLLAHPELRLTVSVSATTRSPRPGEVPGRDYFFVTPEQFEQMRVRGELLEYAPGSRPPLRHAGRAGPPRDRPRVSAWRW